MSIRDRLSQLEKPFLRISIILAVVTIAAIIAVQFGWISDQQLQKMFTHRINDDNAAHPKFF